MRCRLGLAAFVSCRLASARLKQVDDDRSDPRRHEVYSLKGLGVGWDLLPCATTDQSKERNRPLPRVARRFLLLLRFSFRSKRLFILTQAAQSMRVRIRR